MATWKEMLKETLADNGETFDDIEANTMSEEEMNIRFSVGYGDTEGIPFTVWTKNTVYFPICYDGSEWVGCVSRHPNGKPTSHQGGG